MSVTVVHVAVDGDGDGNLTVTWEQDGDGPVEITIGPTPETIDHSHPAAVVQAGRRCVLAGRGRGRHYVAVAPAGGGSAVVAAERLVRLEGTTNFRDLGGYPTADGRRTRWGTVFRSDGLHRLTVEDVAVVSQLGLRVVYDLRRDEERERDPSVGLAGDVRRELLSMGGQAGKGHEIVEQIATGELERLADDFLSQMYRLMLGADGPQFSRLLTGLTDPGGLPALFHCTAGKDRTGASAALLLALLGVDEATIVDDYALTGPNYTAHRLAELRPRYDELGVDIERLLPLFDAPRVAMEALLREVADEYGGAERYLREQGGMDAATVAELRRLLLQPA